MRILFLVFFFLPITSRAQVGYIEVTTNLESYYLVVNSDYENVTLRSKNERVEVPVGETEIRLIWEGINDFVNTYIIQENQVFEIRPILDFDDTPKNSSLAIVRDYRNLNIYTDDESDIYLNGTYLGTGHVSGMLNPGSYQLNMVHPEFGSLKKQLNIYPVKFHEEFRFNDNPSHIGNALKIIPGVGYFSNGEHGKSIGTWMGMAFFGLNLWIQQRNYNLEYDRYKNLVDRYQSNSLQSNFPILRAEIKEKINILDRRKTQVNASILATGLFYAYTTYRGFRKPTEGFSVRNKRKRNEIKMQLENHDGYMYGNLSIVRNF